MLGRNAFTNTIIFVRKSLRKIKVCKKINLVWQFVLVHLFLTNNIFKHLQTTFETVFVRINFTSTPCGGSIT